MSEHNLKLLIDHELNKLMQITTKLCVSRLDEVSTKGLLYRMHNLVMRRWPRLAFSRQ